MSDIAQIVLSGVVFLGLMLVGFWIPFAISISALLYIYLQMGIFGFHALGLVTWGSMDSFTLTAVPLFILMAELLLESGLSDRIYRGLSRIVVHLPGGLLQTNIAGCAVFAAISGSSVATAAAIGSVALPQLEARNYDRRLAAGTLAAGGTLGILIPPSIAMIVYGTFTETSISKLFMAGLVPGIVLVALFMLFVAIRTKISPELAPREADIGPTNWLQVANDILPFAVLIALVMGSLYFGLVTPTESAALGSCLATVICYLWGGLDWAIFCRSIRRTVEMSGAILFIVYAAYVLSYAIGIAGLAENLVDGVKALHLNYLEFLLVIVLLYTILGCLMDSIGMVVVTVPILYPVLLSYGVDPIWFGVALVLLIELGQITPPLGLNLFVVQSMSPGGLNDVIRGTAPFYLLIYLLLALMIAFPALALWLPSHMTGV